MRRASSALAFAAVVLATEAGAARGRLPGKTLDFVYDGADVGHPERAYTGRLYVDPAVDPERPAPVVVFLHGTNVDHEDFRWMGGGKDPDLRETFSQLIASGELPPVVLAAPSTVRMAEVPWTMWPAFDLDRFLEHAIVRARGRATIDLDRVVLVGHSGGACNSGGSIFAGALGTTLTLRGVLAIDGCMELDQASLLGGLRRETDVVVTYQPWTWKRPYEGFSALFREASPEGAARAVIELRPGSRDPHNAILPMTLQRYLPSILAGRAQTT